MKTLTQNME